MLCDKNLPLRLKGKVIPTVVRLALLYGVECWPVWKPQVQRMMVVEMRMMHWMCGHTRLDMIRNAVIRDKSRSSALGR